MTGRTTAEECAKALRDLGVEIVIVKLGPQGCYVHGKGCSGFLTTSPAAGKVNTTGAGDAFCGTLLAKCLQGVDIIGAALSANESARRVVCS